MNIPSINSVSGSSQPADSFQRAGRKEETAKFISPEVRTQGSTTEPGADANSKRLRAYAKKIGTRLQNALASPDITPRQRAALDAQTAHYRSLMSKLEQAYLPGTGQGNDGALQDMHKQLEGVAKSMHEVLVKTSTAVDITSATQRGGLDTIA